MVCKCLLQQNGKRVIGGSLLVCVAKIICVCVCVCVCACVCVCVSQQYVWYVCLCACLQSMVCECLLRHNGKRIAAVTTITPLVTLMQIDHNDDKRNGDDDDNDDEHDYCTLV